MSKALDMIRHHAYRAKYRYGQYLPLRSPVDVSLELASLCNMSCTYCYHASKDTPFSQGLMSYDTAIKILESAYEAGANSLKFNWRGESTINPIFERVTYWAKMMAHGSIFQERITNSNFKFSSKKENIFYGLANQTKVKISYDSFDAKVFESQRKGGDHCITTRNINRFYNHPARINSGTRIVIQAVRTAKNKDEDIKGLCNMRWPEAEVSIRDMVSGRIAGNLEDLEHIKRDNSERKSCLQAHVRLIFNWQGKCYPCCPDIREQHYLGNIQTDSVKSIFNGLSARNLRRKLKCGSAFNSDPCKNCSSFETYKNFKPGWDS